MISWVHVLSVWLSLRKTAEPKTRMQVPPDIVQIQGGRMEHLPTRSCPPGGECCPRAINFPALFSGTYKPNKFKLPWLGRRPSAEQRKPHRTPLKWDADSQSWVFRSWNCLPCVGWNQRWAMVLWSQYQRHFFCIYHASLDCLFFRAEAVFSHLVPCHAPSTAPDIGRQCSISDRNKFRINQSYISLCLFPIFLSFSFAMLLIFLQQQKGQLSHETYKKNVETYSAKVWV